MRHTASSLMFLLIVTGLGFGQTPSPSPPTTPVTPAPAAAGPTSASELNAVLAQMDKAGATFKSAQADIELVQYTYLVNDTDVQTGQIFFRRKGGDTEVALHILKPHGKQVVIKDGKLTFYDQMTKQTTVRDITNNRADVESFMNLGFGGRSQELLKDYDVKLLGWETVDGVRAARLELVAKSERLKQFFSKIILWIDPQRNVALKQQRFQISRDYQVTHYTNIKFGKVPDNVFQVKRTGGGG